MDNYRDLEKNARHELKGWYRQYGKPTLLTDNDFASIARAIAKAIDEYDKSKDE